MREMRLLFFFKKNMWVLDSFFAQVPQRRERKRTNQCSKLPAVVVGLFLLERQSETRESANFRLRRRRLTIHV